MSFKEIKYIKLLVMALLLFVITFYFSDNAIATVRSDNLLGISTVTASKFVLSLLFLLWVLSLTIAGTTQHEQYLVAPMPIALGMFFPIAKFDTNMAFFAFLTSVASVLYVVYIATVHKNLLIRFVPNYILKQSIKLVLLLFSLYTGFAYMSVSNKLPKINVGKTIAEYSATAVKNLVTSSVQNQMEIETSNSQYSELSKILEEYGVEINTKEAASNVGEIVEADVGKTIESQVNSFVQPYQNFIKPIMATLVFGLFQFYAFISYFIYTCTIDLVFYLSRKTRLLETEIIKVDKTLLKF